MECLKDSEEFGISRGEYARRAAMKRRQIAFHRRQNHIEALRARLADSPSTEAVEFELFRTPSGILAYRKKAVRTRYQGLDDMRFKEEDVSLPFVSILRSEVKP